MMARHNATGRLGERLAAAWIEKQGYKIMERNWRAGHLEIDLIASRDSILYFIEVKTARSIRFGYPEQKITQKKWISIKQASMAYLRSQCWYKQICYHVLSIIISESGFDFFLMEDVFLF